MFDFITTILAYFYSLVGNYGIAIVMLTLLIMIVFTPLTFRATRSMIAMREVQPQIRKLQKKHKDDREKLNQETMALYQKHGVNPLGGCLPLFFQAPVFLVLFRVIRGLTRREVDTGYAVGNAISKIDSAQRTQNENIDFVLSDTARRNFNPEYLDPSTEMYQDLVQTNQMRAFGLDLSRSANEVLTDSITTALPYLLIIVAIGILSWYQQKQISGRNPGAEINPQMQMITKIIPWMLPIFSFTMPAALCVYFIGQSVVRVGQQHFITRRYYGEGYDSGLDIDDDDDDDDDDDEDEDEGPGGLLGMLTGQSPTPKADSPKEAGVKHGSRSPVSSTSKPRNRTRPPGEGKQAVEPKPTARTSSRKATSEKSTNKAAAGSDSNGDGGDESPWARAKRSARARADDRGDKNSNGDSDRTRRGARRASSNNSTSTTSRPTSKRVTPKGGSNSTPGSRKRK